MAKKSFKEEIEDYLEKEDSRVDLITSFFEDFKEEFKILNFFPDYITIDYNEGIVSAYFLYADTESKIDYYKKSYKRGSGLTLGSYEFTFIKKESNEIIEKYSFKSLPVFIQKKFIPLVAEYLLKKP